MKTMKDKKAKTAPKKAPIQTMTVAGVMVERFTSQSIQATLDFSACGPRVTVPLGLGRIVAVCCRSSTSYQIH